MSLQRQHFLLSYFKTPSVDPAGVELTTSRVTAQCSTNRATGARNSVPYIFRDNPRRLESLTICRCHYKGSIFSSVIVRP